MGAMDWIFDGKSKSGRWVYGKMIRLLDVSGRRRINDPEKVVEAAGIQPGQVVLEIGCGSGYFTVPAARRLEGEGTLYSIDISPIAVEETRKKVEASGLANATVLQEDACHTRLDGGTFDRVLLFGVIPSPFISNKDLAREVDRLLKPDGMAALWPFWWPGFFSENHLFTKAEKRGGVTLLKKVT
jgi:demethylmenaquinone methyltransferase/2-methoxy-6-polyprenyl-1,4-benzoquinol methylase